MQLRSLETIAIKGSKMKLQISFFQLQVQELTPGSKVAGILLGAPATIRTEKTRE